MLLVSHLLCYWSETVFPKTSSHSAHSAFSLQSLDHSIRQGVGCHGETAPVLIAWDAGSSLHLISGLLGDEVVHDKVIPRGNMIRLWLASD